MVVHDVSLVFVGYVLTYGAATLGCGWGLVRALGIDDDETRRGLVGLLAGSGGWAALEFAFLVAPGTELRYAAYTLSLIVGLTTVGAWLYFCSAYTGRSFHRTQAYRRAAVAGYLLIVGVKLTNPLHGLYFTTEFVTTPFPHLTVDQGIAHWIVTGLSYSLAAVGFFMLYERFLEADYDTRALAAVVAATGLPVLLDIAGDASAVLLDINYEPLGVALFAVGVLYVFRDRFVAVQLTEGVDDAIVHLDADDRIRECNGRARELFPALADATGKRLDAVLPDVAAHLDDDDDPIVERDREDGPRYYLVNDTSFALGGSTIGRMVVIADVTETERRRRELERQNEQLEGFAAAIRHELLNAVQIVGGQVDLAGRRIDGGDPRAARESLRTASETADRMARIVDDLATLARYGQTLEKRRAVAVGDLAEEALETAEVDDLALSVEGHGEIEADPSRLRELFEHAFEFAGHNGASRVTVELLDDGFAIADDGKPPDTTTPEEFFAYDAAVPDAAAGMALPNLRTLARVHGWGATLDTDYDRGVRIVVGGATVRREPPNPA